MNENIKFEYYIFIKKIKEKIYFKKQIKENIIQFQKRAALDQLLMNVVFKMKNDILKEKLKNLLIKKFIYKLMNQYIESYNKGNLDKIESNEDKFGLLESQKRIFNNFIFKSYVFSFFKRVKISLNNRKIKNIQNSIIIKKRNDDLKNYFQQIKEYKSYTFEKEKKLLFKKIFFSKIKYLMLNNTNNNINNINRLTNTKKLFVFKIHYKLFIKNIKSFKARIINIKAIKQKLEKYKDNNRKALEVKKYFKIFINKVKIKKKQNDYLKRKIFNIIKKNVIISKEIKHYLNEAEEIN